MAPTIATPISGKRLSSVVPAEVTAEEVRDHHLTGVDLAVKLHYIRGVYIFGPESNGGAATIGELKTPMFPLLHLVYTASGRIRRSKFGRPFVKCNDSGVRIVEAQCEKTVEEWMDGPDFERCFDLVHDQVLGPDLGFSPLVYIQFTQFKCGGLAVGLSWAHILGDIFSASAFINMWGQFLQGHVPIKSLHVPSQPEYPLSAPRKPLSIKRVDPVNDCWLAAGDSRIGTHSFHLTGTQLENIPLDVAGTLKPANFSHFELISAIIWKSLSKIRKDSGVVTICTRNPGGENEFPSNRRLSISTVEVDFAAAKVGAEELAAAIAEKKEEENKSIEEAIEGENGDVLDYILYGANLTFVNMEEADIYGLEFKGHKPIYANYSIKGVGDGGAVVVLPAAESGGGRRGKTVTVMLPENEVAELKIELKREWDIV